MADPITVALKGSLEGRSIEVDPDQITMGFLEDLQSGTAGQMLTALGGAVVGGDLPNGYDRDGLRRLTPTEFGDLAAGVAGVTRVPSKSR